MKVKMLLSTYVLFGGKAGGESKGLLRNFTVSILVITRNISLHSTVVMIYFRYLLVLQHHVKNIHY